MGGSKKRRRKQKTAESDRNDGNGSGVLVHLESSAANSDDSDAAIPSAWPVDFVQNIEVNPPKAIFSSENIPSVTDVGLHMVRGTLERMRRRSHKKSKKNAGLESDETAIKPTAIQLSVWPALLKSFESRASAGSPADALNVVGIAPTGSGKTMSYCIPIVAHCVRILLQQSHTQSKPIEHSTMVHGLVLVPTRELATQVSKESKVAAKVANKYLSKCVPDSSPTVGGMAVYGGVDMDSQLNLLLGKGESTGPRSLVVAATAGRLLDILKQSTSPVAPAFAHLQAVVFDEADRIAVNGDMAGQVDEILGILKVARTPNTSGAMGNTDVISCLVSATLPEKAKEMCEKWVPRSRIVVKIGSVKVGDKQSTDRKKGDPGEGNDAEDAKGSGEETPSNVPAEATKGKRLPQNLDLAQIPAHIVQTLHVCSNHKKPKKLMLTLQRMYARNGQERGRFSVNNRLCIVFFAQIKTVKYVSKIVAKEERIPKCVELHGSLHQAEREKRLLEFKAGKRPILLATDVAARGLHIPNVHFVVNYDFPGSLDQYVHRCGRAGRSQSALSGTQVPPTVYSFFTREFAAMADSVVELLKTCDAWLDPNLLALTKEKGSAGCGSTKSGKKRKRGKSTSEKSSVKESAAESDDDADPFAFLGKSVLKRASHVSDAEDSDGESD